MARYVSDCIKTLSTNSAHLIVEFLATHLANCQSLERQDTGYHFSRIGSQWVNVSGSFDVSLKHTDEMAIEKPAIACE